MIRQRHSVICRAFSTGPASRGADSHHREIRAQSSCCDVVQSTRHADTRRSLQPLLAARHMDRRARNILPYFPAITAISMRCASVTSVACTVARAGAAPSGTHTSHSELN
jgi:hypothetical protein